MCGAAEMKGSAPRRTDVGPCYDYEAEWEGGLLLRTVCDHDQEDGSFEVRTKISISYYVLLVCLVYMTAGCARC